jgi:thiamine-phosphate pyrophosphorylase
MQFELSPATARALEAAARWARHELAEAVQPAHLLLGLTDEDEGRVVSLLRDAGLALERFRPDATPPAAMTGDVPLDVGSREVLAHARRWSATVSVDRTITTEHLLFALLANVATVRGRLQSLGLDWPKLEAALRDAQGTPIPLPEPLDLGDPQSEASSPVRGGAAPVRDDTPSSAEPMDVARVLDATANRAREALRVVEDYTRFVLDDAFLSGELKRLRHDLAAALTAHGFDLPTSLAARETLRDVGTAITTEHEHSRNTMQDVLAANCKRLQEALRSLEEFGKLRTPALGQAIEPLRYRSYTLERALVRGNLARTRLANARLYLLVTGDQCKAGLERTIAEAAAGGVNVVQLREKNLNDHDLWQRARDVRHWTRQAGVLFIMNDRPDLALLAEADGVHLGQDELPVKEARRIVGADALIGVSTHSLAQLRQAILDGADHVGVGPTFPSGTKTFTEFPGLDFVQQAAAETSLPTFAIGGIRGDNIDKVVAAGARRVAVSQAVCQADDPRQAAAGLRRSMQDQAS